MRSFYLAALLMFLAASPTASLAENEAPSLDPRAQKLLRDIEDRRSLPISDKRWKYKNGPWAEYLDRHLQEGPGSEYHALLEKAWEKYDCSSMISLVHKDFVQRFAYLAPAHAKEHVRDYFKWTFIYELALLTTSLFFLVRDKALVFSMYELVVRFLPKRLIPKRETTS